jgi:translation initiation factor IF-3
VIDEDGAQIGVMPPQQALEIARGKGLDLVEIAPQAQPPVCRIINFGKYQYEQKKKQKEAKAKQTFITVRRSSSDREPSRHDYDFKKNNAIESFTTGTRSSDLSISRP